MPTTANDAAETRAMRERFPKLSKGAAAFQAAMIVLFNAYLLKLVLDGDLSPLAIQCSSGLDSKS